MDKQTNTREHSNETRRELPAFRVMLSDGTGYITSMAHNTTIGQARAYFVDQWFEQSDEKTMLQCIKVIEA